MYEEHINPFHKLLLVKIFREEKVLFSSQLFVEHFMGSDYVNVVAPNMHEVFADSKSNTPIIFIFPQGADPMSLIKRLEVDMKAKPEILSLGQGMETKTKKAIDKGIQSGDWVIL